MFMNFCSFVTLPLRHVAARARVGLRSHARATAPAFASVCAAHGSMHVAATDRGRDPSLSIAPGPAFAHACAPALAMPLCF